MATIFWQEPGAYVRIQFRWQTLGLHDALLMAQNRGFKKSVWKVILNLSLTQLKGGPEFHGGY